MNADYMNTLLQELGTRMGITSLVFDDERLCHLVIDNTFPLTLHYDFACARITLVGKLADSLPGPASKRWMEQVLAAALNPISGEAPGVGWRQDMGLIAYQQLAVPNLTASLLEATMADFVAWLTTFSIQLAETASSVPAVSVNPMRYEYDRV
ncbi:CesT family type III secretion system chaperone [Chitinimonas sp. BJB300]|uniref:CesT family type III secretion system chaperone n=1 Tax=Chitinimonas sp. BJB300 TaxID=1559339 RepID=UPI000C11230A|nr:CesT family type III secretion system chaperone [Chitinimonas sp. BJB300]PHV10028.1 hypothetical protein CSQ89_18425 [Chitinimonas sp. BJB300]TSJ90138.1 hypothetical protein FG002_008140 [Chitinimonas sp. BJB300]